MLQATTSRSSLTRKLLAAYVPLVGAGVLVVFAAIEIRSYKRQLRTLERALAKVTELQASAFANAVWEINQARLESLLRDLARTTNFHSAIVRDTEGEVLAKVGDPDDGDPDLSATERLVYRSDRHSEDLGSMTVSFDQGGIRRALHQRLKSDALVVLFLTVSLICVTLLATRRMIINPIARLRNRVLKIADGAGDVSLEDLQTGDEIGNLAGAFATMQRKVADREEALENARESTLHELMESAPDAMVVADSSGLICRSNSAAGSLFGYAPQELCGMQIDALIPERFRDGHGAHLLEFFKHPTSRTMGSALELFGQRQDGSEFPVEIGLSPFHDPEGTMAVAAIRDITERKQAEKELADKEKRFRTLVANLPGTVYRCLHDEHWTMLFISDDAEALTGYPASDFVQNAVRTYESVIHPDDREGVSNDVEAAVAAGESWDIRYRIVRSDGDMRWVGEIGRAIAGEGGEIKYLDGVINDITAWKELEEQLEIAREQAETANRAKSDFLSSMSHELRTPLNGILGYAQILQRDAGATDRQKDNVGSIINCGDHLLALINDVLDLSKIEAGRIDLDLAPCDLAKLIRSVSDIVAGRAAAKGLEFGVEVSPEVPSGIVTDSAKLRQCLVNLLGNAVKFTSEGKVELHVSERPERRLAFEVADTGVGIGREELEEIFDPFKQVEAGKAAGGTGLGLAITKRLVEEMGGQVEVDSQVGEGSRFTIVLPLEETDEAQLEPDEAGAEAYLAATSLTPGQTVRVLVADDRQANRDILEQLLRDAGFIVELVDDGDTALAALRRSDFDLVLLDIRMPRLNGIEAIRKIREDEKLKDLTVVAVTASVFPEFRDKAIATGFDDFLPKPFRFADLMRVINEHLEVEWQDPEQAAPGACEETAKESPAAGGASLGGLAEETLAELRAALKIKNISALKKLAENLERDPATAAAGAEISRLVRAFDFRAIESLLEGN